MEEIYDRILARPLPAPEAPAGPSYQELVEFARFTQKFWKEGIEIMRKHNLKIESDSPMEKLAFTFYMNLCEIDSKAGRLFKESYGEENYKDERLPDGTVCSPEHDAAIRKEEREKVLVLIEGRIEGLQILLKTPKNKKTMTDAELQYAIEEIKIIRDCVAIDQEQHD